MADIILTPIPSPASTALQAVSAESPPLTATQLPSILAQLPLGTLIRGFVLNRDAQGNPILRTDQGDFKVQSPFFLKIGSDVVVRISAQQHATIVSVDGLPPQTAESRPAHSTVADVYTPSTPASPAPTASITTGRPVATTLTPETQTAEKTTTAAPSTLPVLTATVARVTTSPASQPQIPTAFTSSIPNAIVPQPALPVGTELHVQVVPPANTPPSTASTPILPLPLLPSAPGFSVPVTASVLQALATGETVLQSAMGEIRVTLPQPLPEGATVRLNVLQVMLPSGAATPPTPALPLSEFVAALTPQWRALEDIMKQLALPPFAAQQSFIAALPQVPGNFAAIVQNNAPPLQHMNSGLLFFLSALTGGDVRDLIGRQASEALERGGHASLLQKAQSDFTVMRQLFFDSPPQNWQAMFVPVIVEGELRNIRFYTRRDKGKRRKAQNADGDTRFVVETELSQLGEIQLDGFVKKRPGATQFDLIVRTHAPFAEAEKNDMRALYQTVGEITGYTGALIFQEMPEFPVHPMEEILAGGYSGMVA